VNFLITESQKDFNDIRKLWGEIFGNQHPMVLKKELMNWFYKPPFNPLPSGFRYSKSSNSNLSAFIGYRTVEWSNIEEVWICGFGAIPSKPGAGFFLLRDFLQAHSEKTLCVVGFIPELGKLYTSMGFIIEEGFRNLARVTNIPQNISSFKLFTSKDFFSNHSDIITQQFYNSYVNLFTNHITWEYFVFVRHGIAFFVRKEADLICRVVMAYDIENKNFSKLTGGLVVELYHNVVKYFNYEYIDFICNIDFSIDLSRSNINPMNETQLPGYFSPEASYKPLNFAIKSIDKSKRNLYFKADGDQERSNGK